MIPPLWLPTLLLPQPPMKMPPAVDFAAAAADDDNAAAVVVWLVEPVMLGKLHWLLGGQAFKIDRRAARISLLPLIPPSSFPSPQQRHRPYQLVRDSTSLIW